MIDESAQRNEHRVGPVDTSGSSAGNQDSPSTNKRCQDATREDLAVDHFRKTLSESAWLAARNHCGTIVWVNKGSRNWVDKAGGPVFLFLLYPTPQLGLFGTLPPIWDQTVHGLNSGYGWR